MASIVRNHARGTFQIEWHDGQRLRRTTVTRRPEKWKPGDKLPRKAPSAVLERLAAYRAREAAARQNEALPPDTTAERFLAAYRDGYAARVRPGTLVQFDLAAGKFLGYAKAHRATRLDQVDRVFVARFVAHRSRAATHATVKKECGLLGGAWAAAVADGRAAENPWRKQRVAGAPGRRHSHWTPGEFARLIEHSRPWLRVVLALGANTGLRIAALRQLTWRDVRFSRPGEKGFGFVVVPKELDKAKAGYAVPMSARCHDLLFERAAAGPDKGETVVTGQGGRPIRSNGVTRKAILSACERAGLPRPDSANHAMRRTFGRWAVTGELTGRPVPVYVVSKWLGHHSTAQTEGYLDLHELASQEWMTGQDPPPP